MIYDPLKQVVDESLVVDSTVLQELRAFRGKPKLEYLPGINPTEERERLSTVVNQLIDALLFGIEAHPTKLWVMAEFQRHLATVQNEDTEGREHLGIEIERIMDILSIESSDGLLSFYLGGL
ncbi:MAG: DUF4844 domain-containing protein [Burkholderiaceae bacterium]|jgi:hypothetical protein|nr:DUF4844 domain-containing protein [Burkholderiaceae bacterium]